jgi:UDP-N-acetylmuramate--alanine ligase
MSGIAEVLANQGYEVSGSDLSESATTRRLAAQGIRIAIGHNAQNAAQADAVVVSTAVREDNPEVMMARLRHVPVVPRAQMLAELMRIKQGIAIAGTHGKTTTTSLVASCLAEGGLDPTFVIGGRLNSAGANAKLGSGEFLVAEADESDASFLFLSPVVSVVTNIDADHMETYGHDFGRLKQAFVDFLHRLPFYGVAVVCGDDANVREIMPRVAKQIVTYGIDSEVNFRAEDVVAEGGTMRFTCVRTNGNVSRLPITLNLPGRHNVLNALAAIAVATEVGVGDTAIVKALADFRGVGGASSVTAKSPAPPAEHFTLVDDYGHHPVEMAATLAAARGAFPGRGWCWPSSRIATRAPATASRTSSRCLCGSRRPAAGRGVCRRRGADHVPPTAARWCAPLRIAAKDRAGIRRRHRGNAGSHPGATRDGDVVITMGAGSIGAIPGKLSQAAAHD